MPELIWDGRDQQLRVNGRRVQPSMVRVISGGAHVHAEMTQFGGLVPQRVLPPTPARLKFGLRMFLTGWIATTALWVASALGPGREVSPQRYQWLAGRQNT